MELANIIASLRRNTFGAMLVALQVALTLAIVSNALFIATKQMQRVQAPTGLDEANIFSMSNEWVGQPVSVQASLAEDLQILRSLPGVIDAYATNFLPLSGPGESSAIGLDPLSAKTERSALTGANLFWVDEHALQTLGLRVVAGRWFKPEEVVTTMSRPSVYPQVVISRALAEKISPKGSAVGQTIYSVDYPMTVIGVIDRMTGAWSRSVGGGLDIFENTVLTPYVRATVGLYVVRTQPGRTDAAMREAERRLRAANPARIISDVRPFKDTRWEGLRQNRSLALMFSSVCVLLLVVTALGIVGITSFWISQRIHHIGMRRALGARRGHILAYYQTENLLLVGTGTLIGVALAIILNLWLMSAFGTQRIDSSYVITGAVAVMILGQLAAFWPARRAASIPPALATRAS
jgi:putative ABC transport system permease protein